MAFSIEIYCDCGAKAKYTFQTAGAYEEYKALWKRDHDSKGHKQVFKSQYQRIVRERQRQRKAAL